MKIAVPISSDRVSDHFGHCEQFAFFCVDGQAIGAGQYVSPPAHEPGVFPKWLKSQGAEVVITGGLGRRAQDLLSQQGIQVISGISTSEPKELVKQYIEGTLVSGENRCSH